MPVRGAAMLPSTINRILICVDQVSDGEIGGRLLNPYYPRAIPFQGFVDLTSQMDAIFDDLSFPQVYFDYRTFRNPPASRQTQPKPMKEVQRYMDDTIFETEQGQKATFIVQVQFRQNATWQGTIQWADEKKTRRFRSTLELLKLMGDAIDQNATENALPVGWDEETDEI